MGLSLRDGFETASYARGKDAEFSGLLPTLDVAICGIVRAELLCGARHAEHCSDLGTLLATFHHLPIPETLWDTVGDNLRRCGMRPDCSASGHGDCRCNWKMTLKPGQAILTSSPSEVYVAKAEALSAAAMKPNRQDKLLRYHIEVRRQEGHLLGRRAPPPARSLPAVAGSQPAVYPPRRQNKLPPPPHRPEFTRRGGPTAHDIHLRASAFYCGHFLPAPWLSCKSPAPPFNPLLEVYPPLPARRGGAGPNHHRRMTLCAAEKSS